MKFKIVSIISALTVASCVTQGAWSSCLLADRPSPSDQTRSLLRCVRYNDPQFTQIFELPSWSTLTVLPHRSESKNAVILWSGTSGELLTRVPRCKLAGTRSRRAHAGNARSEGSRAVVGCPVALFQRKTTVVWSILTSWV